MGDGVLSQDEINALLSGGIPDAASADDGGSAGGGGELSSQEIDTIGEVANISMGSAATTLFSLVNKSNTNITAEYTKNNKSILAILSLLF